ncbi:MAG: peptide chain release factor N(5)-glutamine methyltransferase [Thermodesulfovibrio sp.]|uniref:peptide chain release factor N(5)-glutamine methyltransferase n=1 Tax=unclassified Thermodesulfovibrio TaxID=2645936 RepID=UPI00083A4A0D|nr:MULTISPECIES: peptide chain release factor N(5)-glutamine methyltransferase [unclassified Thermodesulfovibrio]MDI1472054.1 peptide chain release factor N(5)-glutamine methyltransferase [Thermodesulfovibrio sp. 1176]MDI6713742.1 peptide chain release factor N(5)-glutamine methyltransferase [Thermodesulfovibrio sp.]ODA45188.1 Protein-N(5)-glutamine methyltransferase PrmC, methylates polypeptide chain release factors RF1 and RF2 [Thermodesulfovibrio sp. N1]
MNALKKIEEIKKIFEKNQIPFPQKEAQEIVCHIAKIDKVKLYSQNPQLTSIQIYEIDRLVQRRLKREPLQYIIGECDFFNIKLKVGPGVLIPRPETEILIEEFLKREEIINKKDGFVVDLCTGSGCIALSIAKNLPQLKIIGVDISENAIKYAHKNKILNSVSNAFFVVGDLLSPLKKNSFISITANPPYVESDEIKNLQPEIKDFEPKEALDGGQKGLLYYEKILNNAEDYLIEEGLIFFEIGIGQAEEIKKMAEKLRFKMIKIVPDLAGIERVMILKRS